MTQSLKFVVAIFTCIFFIACDSKPKVIVADENPTTQEAVNSSITTNATTPSPGAGGTDVHKVTVNDVLQAERYTYLNVTEGIKSYWLATAKREASKGKTYLYKGGLMKTNFESQDFKRTFDTIYLVSNVIDATEHPGGDLSAGNAPISSSPNAGQTSNVPVKDAVKLSVLMANKTKYAGKTITVSGECVKVNNGIMGKNWVHIQDGSKDKGKALDLTITTNLNIAVGSKVALTGKIVLDKDFGAGYRYDIIMEDAGGM
jgi:GW (Gly-Tryp) dipeptide domain